VTQLWTPPRYDDQHPPWPEASIHTPSQQQKPSAPSRPPIDSSLLAAHSARYDACTTTSTTLLL
jgi:hypothetical protein